MCPVLQLLLLVTAKISGSFATLDDDTGLNFVVVFLENIAFYHPVPPQNTIRVTASRDGTTVTITTPPNQVQETLYLQSGETREFSPAPWLELRKQGVSDRVLSVSSNKKVSVQAISLKLNSVQTALVIPTHKLGTEYAIPPLPQIQGTTDVMSTDVTERRPFALFIISATEGARVEVGGVASRTLNLDPHQVAQVLLQEAEGFRWVNSNKGVVVVLGHACAMRFNCTCGLLQSVLPSAKPEKVRFFIPPFLSQSTASKTRLLVSPTNSTTDILNFDPSSPTVDTDGVVLLFQPGLLLPLITEADFASCFLLNGISGVQTFAVITVRQDSTAGVQMGNAPLQNATWKQLSGTNLVWTMVELQQQKNVFWHSFYKMAVYFYGKNGSARFGNMAPIISVTPDFRGCLLDPEVLTIRQEAGGWRESVRRCRDGGLNLLSLSAAVNVTHIHSLIVKAKNSSLLDVWIGLRRNSQSGAWYWIDNAPINTTGWQEGEPGAVNEGQCAVMSLQSAKEFGWSDEDCCRAIQPICYKPPTFFPL